MELGESSYKGREARFMVLAVELGSMPSSERSLQRKVMEINVRAGLKTYTPMNLSVSGARLVFQEKIFLEQGKIRGNSKKWFIEMDNDINLKNGIGIEMD
jgi:hypothetical protein